MSWSLVQGRTRFVTALSYEVDPVVLRGLVPAGTEVDTFEGCALLSLVAQQFAENRLLGVPVPFARHYDQIDLRFYVRRRVEGEWRRGVAFVRELLPVGSIASLGHLLYGEAYQRMPVSSRVHPPETADDGAGRGVYRWLVDGEVHRLDLDFSGELCLPTPGSIDEFVLDRAWGYVFYHSDLTREYRVDHPPWRIWPAVDVRLSEDAAPVFGQRFAHILAEPPRAALVSEGSRVQMHRPATITAAAARRAAEAEERAAH
ncbi:MAG TPA: DUF2071 domain-containing protein [Kofleriaceae bacterium]|nr:DUF2071 domain-containing protein [Kofleriaceae bacterium]